VLLILRGLLIASSSLLLSFEDEFDFSLEVSDPVHFLEGVSLLVNNELELGQHFDLGFLHELGEHPLANLLSQ